MALRWERILFGQEEAAKEASETSTAPPAWIAEVTAQIRAVVDDMQAPAQKQVVEETPAVLDQTWMPWQGRGRKSASSGRPGQATSVHLIPYRLAFWSHPNTPALRRGGW